MKTDLPRQEIEIFDREVGLWPAEAHLIAEFFPEPPARVLDLGCGNGRTTIPLASLGYNVVGVDLSPDAIAAARRRGPNLDFRVGDAAALEFPDGEFDAALFSWNGLDCLPTLELRRRALREIRRVLRAGGRFLFSSHNALGCWGRLIKPPALTMRALRFLLDQFPPHRSHREWYFAWRDSTEGRRIFRYYSAPPGRNVRELTAAGWRVLAVRSDLQPDRPARTWRDVHVHYACERAEIEQRA